MIRHALESFLVAWRHVPGYRELSSRRTPLNTLVFAQCVKCAGRRGAETATPTQLSNPLNAS